MLDEGRLGRLVGVSAATNNWRPQSYYDQPGRGTRARDGGGVLLTQGIHTLDLMLSLAGSIAEVTGYARTSPVHRMETEDLAWVPLDEVSSYPLHPHFAAAWPGLLARVRRTVTSS